MSSQVANKFILDFLCHDVSKPYRLLDDQPLCRAHALVAKDSGDVHQVVALAMQFDRQGAPSRLSTSAPYTVTRVQATKLAPQCTLFKRIVRISELTDWYLTIKRLKPVSARGMRVAFKALARHCGDLPLASIGAAQIQDFRVALSIEVKSATFNSYMIQIRAACRLMVNHGLLSNQHPIFAIRKSRIPDGVQDILSQRDIGKIRAYLLGADESSGQKPHPKAWFWHAVFETFYRTGMRRRQLCELIWADIDMEVWTITYRAESSKNGRGWTIPCPTALRSIFAHLHELSSLQLKAAITPDTPVFHRQLSVRLGRRAISAFMRPNYVTNQLEQISRLAGCTHLCSPHKLRHTAATRWLEFSGQIKTVKTLLGHSDSTHTFGYTHPEIESARQLLQRSSEDANDFA